MKLGLIHSAPIVARLASLALAAGVDPDPRAFGELTLKQWTARVRDRKGDPS